MQVRRLSAVLFAAAMLPGAAALAQSSKPAPMDHGMMGGGGMMGGSGGGMGMMNMMQECKRMMGDAAPRGARMPKMPPGNEKLEFQMHAEMMQKMGEIAAKYAERIREGK